MGYLADFSMSNRAADAYVEGQQPLSKWTKKSILNGLEDAGVDITVLRKYSVATLRDCFLDYTGWHHTSKLYNRTDFYELHIPEQVDFGFLDAREQANRGEQARKRGERAHATQQIALVKYGEWEGPSRNRLKLVEHSSFAIIVGTTAYLPGGVRKRTTGSHFEILETYKRAPRGQKNTIDAIRETIKR